MHMQFTLVMLATSDPLQHYTTHKHMCYVLYLIPEVPRASSWITKSNHIGNWFYCVAIYIVHIICYIPCNHSIDKRLQCSTVHQWWGLDSLPCSWFLQIHSGSSLPNSRSFPQLASLPPCVYLYTYMDFQLASYVCVIFMQVNKDPDYFYENNMEIHVKISMDGAQYSRSSSFCLLSFSIFNREYTFSLASKLFWQIAS